MLIYQDIKRNFNCILSQQQTQSIASYWNTVTLYDVDMTDHFYFVKDT